MEWTTESSSLHNELEKKSSLELVLGINQEDAKVADAVRAQASQIAAGIDLIHDRMKEGGRLFYIGSGTSGRLGIVDASECPPTYGVPHGWVIGIIAGGDGAIRKAVEFAEDDPEQAWKDLSEHQCNPGDVVVGISASGTAPYVLGALAKCKEEGIASIALSCNTGSPMAQTADHAIEVVVGPEFVTGSTRMKAGTAQKMVLNMLTTGVMIKLGRVVGNRMVDMQLSNKKLLKRGAKMVADTTGLELEAARKLLIEEGSVRAAIHKFNS